MVFGDENNKDLLAALLGALLEMPQSDFQGLEIMNNELLREFKEDKKGILDVRVKTSTGKQIDIEIQILPTEFMPQRTLYYWSKMYTGQIKSGDAYDSLMKCITINIIDFECIPLPKLHTVFHITEDETDYRLTDMLEVHFLELTKLSNEEKVSKKNDEVTDWMTFIDGKSEGVMKMLSQKNENIKKAYDILQIISKDEKARMLYEAREAEIKDQLTRAREYENRGRLEGRVEGRLEGRLEGMLEGDLEGRKETARNFLNMGMDAELVAKGTGLSLEQVEMLKQQLN